MYLSMILSTLGAWFVGLFLDVNLYSSWQGFTDFRILFPLLAVALFLLKAIEQKKHKADSQEKEEAACSAKPAPKSDASPSDETAPNGQDSLPKE